MPALFQAYPPDRPALVRVLEDDVVYRIGRTNDCELRIDHASVSRFHAELSRDAQGWRLQDTGSKNGLRVDGHLVRSADLAKSTWFAIGDVYCWLDPMDAAAAAAHRAQGEVRRATSRALSERLGAKLPIATLLPQTLDVVLDMAGLERGFVLYADAGDELRVRACRGLDVGDIASTRFGGSRAAVDETLNTGRSVVCCDTADSPWLGARPSVRLGGIRAVVCVALRGPTAALGVVYADSRRPGPPITELDLELIEHVAQQATAALAAARLQAQVGELLRDAQAAGIEAPRWEDLRSRDSG